MFLKTNDAVRKNGYFDCLWGGYPEMCAGAVMTKQGRIHGNTVADGWAGAAVRKPLGIQKCYGTDLPTDQHGKV